MEKIVGNTPIVKIKYKYKEKIDYIYVKLEYYNITGSIKDRMAEYIINKAIKNGELKPNQIITEATSGNTGIAIAALGSKLKHPVVIFMPDWVSKERAEIMKSYGAEIRLYSKKDGGFKRAIQECKNFAKQNNAFMTNQFSNEDNILAHYETTGKEIIEQTPEKIGAFVSGVGTGGTLMGVGRRIRKQYPNSLVVAIEPDKMPLLSKNKIIGEHKIEGIGDDFVPDLINRNLIDKVVVINDDDAVNMARLISRKLGIGCGISSGANFLGAIIIKSRIEESVVTVFADDNKKYLSTDLGKNVDNDAKLISNHVELLDWEEV